MAEHSATAVTTVQSAAVDVAEIDWYDAETCHLAGKGWTDTDSLYDRWPAKAQGMLPEGLWGLGRHSAGLHIDFESSATSLHVRYTLRHESLAMAHFPSTGVSGVDAYARDESGRFRWAGVTTRPAHPETTATLVSNMDAIARQWRLYLPLYNAPTKLEIGVSRGATFTPAKPDARKPIVFYGTSITHGGCASRPGMAYPAILGRRLEYPVLNLGFSGSAKMEMAVAELLVELDPVMYVFDTLPNMGAPLVEERAEKFIRHVVEAKPDTPIVLAEDRTYASAWINRSHRERNGSARAAFRRIYEKLRAEYKHRFAYLAGEGQIGDDSEATVDASHPTDLGFMRLADAFEPVIRSLL